MKTAVILSGLGVIFAIITGLFVMLEKEHGAMASGAAALIFEVIGVVMAIIYL